MHKKIDMDKLGSIIKTARLDKRLTREQLAERIGIGQRHLIGIENENKKPSYEVLFDLVRELNICANSIFYPSDKSKDLEIEQFVLMLKMSDKRLIQMLSTIAKTMTTEHEDSTGSA